MARVVNIHPDSPQQRLLVQAADFIRNGAVVALPTDSCYALGCHLGDREALDRIRQIRQIDERHHLTLMVRDLSEIAHFARVDNSQYRLLKAATPGSYTFILEGTKELPRRLLHPKRKTIGLRIPNHPVALALLEELNEPLLTTTLQLPGDDRRGRRQAHARYPGAHRAVLAPADPGRPSRRLPEAVGVGDVGPSVERIEATAPVDG